MDRKVYKIIGTWSNVTLIRVVDGDTYHLSFRPCCEERIYNCRMKGLNAPERGSMPIENSDECIAFVTKWFEDNKDNLAVTVSGIDKYGRLLVQVYGLNNECLNEIMLQQHYAIAYK
jgi:endonuclease YncB( thermonuclease family)